MMIISRTNNFEDLVKQRCQLMMMMVSQEGVARTTQQLGSLMKTATLCRIQVPTYRGNLKNHGSLWLTSRILHVVFYLIFHTPQNLSSYMAVPYLDAVTDFCDDTEDHFHDQGTSFSTF